MQKTFEITNIDCPICAGKLSGALNKIDGIHNAEIDFLTERLTLESDLPSNVLTSVIRKTIKKALPEAVLGDEI